MKKLILFLLVICCSFVHAGEGIFNAHYCVFAQNKILESRNYTFSYGDLSNINTQYQEHSETIQVPLGTQGFYCGGYVQLDPTNYANNNVTFSVIGGHGVANNAGGTLSMSQNVAFGDKTYHITSRYNLLLCQRQLKCYDGSIDGDYYVTEYTASDMWLIYQIN